MKKRKKMPFPAKRNARVRAVPAEVPAVGTAVYDVPRETRSVAVEVEYCGRRYRGELRDGLVDMLVYDTSNAWVSIGRGRWTWSDEWSIGDVEAPIDTNAQCPAPSGDDYDEDVVDPDVLHALSQCIKGRLFPIVRCRTLATGEISVIGAAARVVYKRLRTCRVLAPASRSQKANSG